MATHDDVPSSQEPSSSESSSGDDLGSMASFLVAMADAPVARERGALRPGQLVSGKYKVVRAIGEGGMGVVYLARDEKLDRDVALKVGRSLEPAALARTVVEAQALAKLTHPNVVVVHEVGEVDGRLFVAMEHVGGGTARAWSAQRQRGYKAVVDLYAAAGDGLVAAHAAGLIHRDFKPDNVLVGDDGRPRVADFGLVRSETNEDEPSEVVGTRAYMPPEQTEGREVDARADQYSFCASLWEALYDARPFGKGARATRVPRHVEKALRRGLSPSKEDRWPSVADLLAELRRDPAAPARKAATGAAVLLVVAVAILVPLSLRARATQCNVGAAALAPVWTAARGDELGRVFAASGGGVLWGSLKQRIERYASSWVASEEGACKATRVDGTQSEALLDRRVMCLAGARAQLSAVLDGYAVGGHDTIEHASDALALLPDLAACDDVTALGNQTPLPADPGARKAIEGVLQTIATLRASASRGDLKEPKERAAELIAAAEKTGWPPIAARATRTRGTLLRLTGDSDHAREAWREASALALKCGDDDEAAGAMTDLGHDYALATKPAEAKPWIELARAIWTRRGEKPEVGARILEAESMMARARGQYAEAIALVQRSIEQYKRAYPGDPIREAGYHHMLANVYVWADNYADAATEGQVALTAIEAAVGKDHPKTANYAEKLASAEIGAGKFDAALAHARQALAINEVWYGPTSSALTAPLEWIGMALAKKGDKEGARAAYERELAILKATGSKVDLAALNINMGITELGFGNLAKALEYAEAGLALHVEVFGAGNANLAIDYVLLGGITRDLGKLADSEKHLRRALALFEGERKDGTQAVNGALELSYTLVKEHRAAEAVALMAPKIAVCEKKEAGISPNVSAEAHQAYAEALWEGGDRALAIQSATAARDAYAALGADFAGARKQSEDWLAAHHPGGASPAH